MLEAKKAWRAKKFSLYLSNIFVNHTCKALSKWTRKFLFDMFDYLQKKILKRKY